MSVKLCIDNACETLTILNHIIIPIPLCNDNFTLPGGDTLNGFFEELGLKTAGAGVHLVLEYLGLSVSFACKEFTLTVFFLIQTSD